jgi:hypothetical protein
MTDLFEMLQSRTFVQQFGYGLLKIVLVNLFPELKLLFRKIERGALEQTDAKAGARAPPAKRQPDPAVLNPPVPPTGMKRGAK